MTPHGRTVEYAIAPVWLSRDPSRTPERIHAVEGYLDGGEMNVDHL